MKNNLSVAYGTGYVCFIRQSQIESCILLKLQEAKKMKNKYLNGGRRHLYIKLSIRLQI